MAGLGAIIVGGTGGIGGAAALRFVMQGARVVIVGNEPEETGREVAAVLSEAGPVRFLRCDVTDEGAVVELFREALFALGGRIDVLFHVAGGSGRRRGDGPLHQCSADGWDWTLGLNARGAFLANREAVRHMLANERDPSGLRGSVVNLGSALADAPAPRHFDTVAYAASKGAVATMTRSCAARYAADGIRFNLIEPGLIDTPMARRACDDPAIQSYLATKQPIGGGPGMPEDVAEAAVFLASHASRFITGATLKVDGGWSISEGQIG
jgi:NAD(P)-dependent dehydrogenase (short-subunit alcohol dehydrogenase family)